MTVDLEWVRRSIGALRRSLGGTPGSGSVSLPQPQPRRLRTCATCEPARVELDTANMRIAWLERELVKAHARISELEAEADAGPPSRQTVRVDARVDDA